MILLALSALVRLATVRAGLTEMNLLSRIAAGDIVSRAEALDADTRMQLLVVASGLLYILIGFPFFFWFYRVYANLQSFGLRRLEYSPGWAIGGFFVPFLNFVRPYEIADEIWSWSFPASPDGRIPSKGTVPVKLWWGLYLAGNLSAYLPILLNTGPRVIGKLILIQRVALFGNVLWIAAAAATILLVKRIDDGQKSRFEWLSTASQAGI